MKTATSSSQKSPTASWSTAESPTAVTCTWLDGRVDCFRRGDPEDIESVHHANHHQVVSDMRRFDIVTGAISAARALEFAAVFEYYLWASATPTAPPKSLEERT